MKRIHILESTLRYLLDEGRNAEKAKQKTIAVMKNYLSQNGIQGGQLEAMALEFEDSFKEWLFHANMPDSIIRLEPIMANVAMQLGFTPQNKDTRELYRLKDITNYIIANYNKEDFPIALNKLTLDNTTFERLNELFGNAIDTSKGVWKPSNDGKLRPHYTVKRLDTFEEANEYHPYTQDICYLDDDETWDDYTCNGRNAVYVLLRDGWEDVPAEHGKDTPYDDYGKSMVFVIIRPNGDVAYTNTRWNHDTDGNGPRDVDQSFTDNMNDVSDMLQTDYRNVLKPYSEEELAEKGFITLSIIRRWISEGKDLLKICKDTSQISENLFEIKLSQESFVLYNSRFNRLMPSDNMILVYIGRFKERYAAIQRDDGKLSFINTEGQQIGDWYYSVIEFYHGFAKVQRDDGKWSFINTEGQQIGDWYSYVIEFYNGFAKVQRDDDKWTLINADGQQICDWYFSIMGLNINNYIVISNKGYEIINTRNEKLLGPYSSIMVYNLFSNQLLVQRKDNKKALFNKHNYNQISNWYTSIKPFFNSLNIVKNENGMVSLINTDGKQICDWYKDITGSLSGFYKVHREDGMVSLINTDGTQICDWYTPNTKFRIVSPNEIYDNNGNLIPLYNESYIRLNNLIAEALHMSIRNYLLYN